MSPMSPSETFGRWTVIERECRDGDRHAFWLCRCEQARNTRRNIYVSAGGERLTIRDWSQRLGIDDGVLLRRVHAGVTVENGLFAPPKKAAQVTLGCISRTVRDWSCVTGIPRRTLHTRLQNGWTAEEALTTSPTLSGRNRRAA